MEDPIIGETGVLNCTNCGAELKYKPGTKHLVCDYCGTVNEIPEMDEVIQELDYLEYIQGKANQEEVIQITAITCKSCGATSSIDPNVKSHFCPYCSTPFVIEDCHAESLIRPKSLLPFRLNPSEAKRVFTKWIQRSFWSPGKLKKAVLNFEHFKGVYLPHWTYDSRAFSSYVGQRGDYYYVTEMRTVVENGRQVQRPQQVRRTRWRMVQGRVNNRFDDVLICSSESVPSQFVKKLEPWDLKNLVPFDDQYLRGFITEKYQIELKEGFTLAKKIMDLHIRTSVARDIGGDEQRIAQVQTRHDDVTFKHILLPAYISAYRFKDKVYRFLINARTGEVTGERPISQLKVAVAISLGLVIVFLLYYFGSHQK
ncbi:MAG: hypothetical protein AAGA85_10390 [Bacteroidota bacterium]